MWSTDGTDIRLERGWIYLVALPDWHGRYVLAREVSTRSTATSAWRHRAAPWRAVVRRSSTPDRGSQVTSHAFTGRLQAAEVQSSMDGRGRALDHVFVERLWRSVKFEEVYPKSYPTMPAAIEGLGASFRSYNEERLHQSPAYYPPAAVYRADAVVSPPIRPVSTEIHVPDWATHLSRP